MLRTSGMGRHLHAATYKTPLSCTRADIGRIRIERASSKRWPFPIRREDSIDAARRQRSFLGWCPILAQGLVECQVRRWAGHADADTMFFVGALPFAAIANVS